MTNGVKDQRSPINEATSDFSQSNFRVTVGERQKPVEGERQEDVDSTEANPLSGTVAGREERGQGHAEGVHRQSRVPAFLSSFGFMNTAFRAGLM